jgi:hypothetical protein
MLRRQRRFPDFRCTRNTLNEGKKQKEGQNDTNLNVVLPLKTSLFISRLAVSDPRRLF